MPKNCQRECRTRPSQLTKSHSLANISSYPNAEKHCMHLQCSVWESAHTQLHKFRIIIIILLLIIFFGKSAISMQEWVDRMILSLSASTVSGGVHGHQAITSLLFLISRVDCRTLQGRQWMMLFSANLTCAKSACASEASYVHAAS